MSNWSDDRSWASWGSWWNASDWRGSSEGWGSGDPWQTGGDPWGAGNAAVVSRRSETAAAHTETPTTKAPPPKSPGAHDGSSIPEQTAAQQDESTAASRAVEMTLALRQEALADTGACVLRGSETPSSMHPPRQLMRALLLRWTDAMGREHPSPLYCEIQNTPDAPWHDYLLTLPPAAKEIVFATGGVTEFGVCSFPEEPDPNTRKPRVDFVAVLMGQIPSMVRLHPGKSAKGDAKPIPGTWSPAMQCRLNYARNQARAEGSTWTYDGRVNSRCCFLLQRPRRSRHAVSLSCVPLSTLPTFDLLRRKKKFNCLRDSEVLRGEC